MAYSYIDYIANGSTVNYSVPFNYIRKDDIDVYLDGVLTTGFIWSNDYSITFNTAPAAGTNIKIKRNTEIEERLVDYQDGSTLTEEILDLDSKQTFYLLQESVDNSNSVMNLGDSNQWNAQNKRIENVANPVNQQDAVTLKWILDNFPNTENTNVQYAKETFVATSGQFTVETVNEYILGSNTLHVYVNGVKLNKDQYSEVNTNQVFFNSSLNDGDIVEVLFVKKIPVLDSSVIKYGDRTVTDKLSDVISVKDFGAIGDGVADDSFAIMNAVNTGNTVYFPQGTYLINQPISMVSNGQKIYGDGKYKTIIKNITNSNPLLIIGNIADDINNFGQYCSVSDMAFIGNATTTLGISVFGIVDDGATYAARDVSLNNIYIQYIGAGYGLKISPWECQTSGITIWDCYKGLLLGAESNSTTMVGTYISRCTNEAVEIKNTSGIPSNINFIGLTAQYSGGTLGTVNVEDGISIQFNGLYLEGNDAPNNVYITSNPKNVIIINGMHNKVDGTCQRIIYGNSVKSLNVHNFSHIGGTVESIVKVDGTLPLTTCSGLFDAVAGLTVGLVDDQSTRKATIHNDPLVGTYGVSKFKSLTSQNNIELVDSATGTTHLSFINGKVVFGTGSAPQIRKEGSSFAFYSDSASTLTNTRIGSAIIGSASVKILSGANSPEGAISGDVGSIFLRTNGGANTTLYVKESGTGTTGWVAK